MPDSAKGRVRVRGLHRSSKHLPLWEVIARTHAWEEAGIELIGLEHCKSPPAAEAALLDGNIDFISGNHLTPYALLAEGKPIVSIASPDNFTRGAICSTEPVRSILDLRGKRVADTPLTGRDGGFRHSRGNHMMYMIRAGMGVDEVEWVEVAGKPEQFEALRSGAADAAITGVAEMSVVEMEFHTLVLEPLPMISGPTITTTMTALEAKPGLGEGLVKALVLGIFCARTKREETEAILRDLDRRAGCVSEYDTLARLPVKPYPNAQAVINAHELSCMKFPIAKQVDALALWDLHYLKMLDASGFIDRLYGAA